MCIRDRHNEPNLSPKVGLSQGSIVTGLTLALFLQPDTLYKMYACGKDKVPGDSNFRATFWNEGIPTYLTNGSSYSTAEDISVTLDNKVYICGEEQFTQSKYTAVYWKPDGSLVKLSNGANNAFATCIIAVSYTHLDVYKRQPREVHLHFDTPAEFDHAKLDTEKKKHLVLKFKEAVNKAIKYSRCKNIHVKMNEAADAKSQLSITDDGIGFDTQHHKN